MNTRQQGNVGLGAAIAYFTSTGAPVFIALAETQRFDLVVQLDGSLVRVEVKTASRKSRNGVLQVKLNTCGGNRTGPVRSTPFDPKDSDLLFVKSLDGPCWLIPTAEISAVYELSLGAQVERYRL